MFLREERRRVAVGGVWGFSELFDSRRLRKDWIVVVMDS